MRHSIVKITFAVLILSLAAAAAIAQGRGRGQAKNLDRKCSVFVNCHDARDGRWDGRGPSRVNRNLFVTRGDRVGYRNRYNMNDYWRHRHVTSTSGWQYRNRTWRNR
ncbi:MAG TPA: hypothetical protein VE961_15210 [Pyrinomonadaceae bacterium]|nr:hypothetical protein [Pyrinomonadaceae bacterium]